MCDDFFDDNFEDNIFDPDNDFEEDMEEDGGEWYEDDEYLLDESETNRSSDSPHSKADSFDLADAMLWGMVGGAFYDAATDEKQQLKRIRQEDKLKK